MTAQQQQQVDVFGGTDTQELGEEREEGVVFSVSLKRVRYARSMSVDCLDKAGQGHLQWNSQKVRTLRAGTVEKIVEHLAPYGKEADVSYRACFLCTFRMFTSIEELLRLLTERYSKLTPAAGNSNREIKLKRSTQNEIILFVRQWMETYPTDFDPSPSGHSHHLSLLRPLTAQSAELARLVETIRHSKDTATTTAATTASPTLTTEEHVISRLRVNSSPKENGSSSPPNRFSLFSLPPVEFAQHLTSHDADLFLGVVDHQCLEYVHRPKDIDNAPTVRSCIEHFNRVSLVVIATILGGVAAEGRGSVISHWIDIAQNCRAVKNFSSLKAIVSGLQSTTVHRLKKSWNMVSSDKKLLFQELADLFAVDDNHRISRDLLTREGTAKYAEVSPKRNKGKNGLHHHGSVQGVVPYLGTFLTDLTMVDSAYSDLTQDGFINFDKCRKQFELLAQLTLYQKSAANYCYSRHPGLDQWLTNMHSRSPVDSYQLSKELEPDDVPSSLYVSEPSLSSLSPARIRRALRHVFNTKGNIVSDSSPSPSIQRSSRSNSRLAPSLSERDILSSIDGPDENERTHIANTLVITVDDDKKIERSLSASPEMRGRDRKHSAPEISPMGHVVRVAAVNHDHCNYVSLLVTHSDKATAVISRVMKKLSIQGSPSNYALYQHLPGNKQVHIPGSANVYYALSKTQDVPTLLLREPKNS